MKRFRRRYRRRTTGAAMRRGLFFAATLVYAFLAVALGVFISGKWLEPMIQADRKMETDMQETQAGLGESHPLLSALVQEEEEMTSELELPAVAVYAVAAGPYGGVEEANHCALSLIHRGGAGYVQECEGEFFVLLSAYDTREAAQTVAERLNGDGGLELRTMDLSCPSARLKITTGQTRTESIQNSYSEFAKGLETLDNAWRSLDRGEKQMLEVVADVQMLADRLEQVRESAFEGALIEGDVMALSRWEECLTGCSSYMQTISGADQSALEISAKIKYTYLACIARYREYILGLHA